MRYKQFGNTDLMVSEVGFGAWAIGGNAVVGNIPIGWGKADDVTSRQAIRKAVDCGINFFDTADFYGLGHSEKLLGEELGSNKEMLLATKVGHRNIAETIKLDYSSAHIVQACEESLKRLRRDYIDYYQLHSARLSHFENENCVEAMTLLQQQGKIRWWGLSLNTFYPAPEADFMIERNIGHGFQLVYNIINQRAYDVMQRAAKSGYGIIARMPLQFGLLTGKFDGKTFFGPDDHRSFRFNAEIISDSLAVLNDSIWPLCEKYGISKTSLALSYILSNPAVGTVIPGVRTARHVVDNTSHIVQLDEEDLQAIRALYDAQLFKVVDLMEARG